MKIADKNKVSENWKKLPRMHPGVPAVPVLKIKVEPSLLVWTPHLKHSCIKTVICKKLPRHFLPNTIFNEVLRMEETMKVLGEPMKLLMFLHGKKLFYFMTSYRCFHTSAARLNG